MMSRFPRITAIEQTNISLRKTPGCREMEANVRSQRTVRLVGCPKDEKTRGAMSQLFVSQRDLYLQCKKGRLALAYPLGLSKRVSAPVSAKRPA
jgi:hypothetical protein